MPADANIFQQYLKAPESVLDYQAAYDQADARKNALQQSVLALQKGQMDMANAADVSRQRNALRDAVTSGQIDLSNPDHVSRALALAPDVAPGLLKTVQEGATSRAVAAKDNATAGKTTQETQLAAHAQHLQALSTINTPQDAMQWMVDGVRSGALPAAGLPAALDRLQQASATPEAFSQWKQQTSQSGQTVQQQMEMTAAKPTEMRLGNVVKTIDMNPRSASFGKEVVGQQQVGVSPDTAANNATSRANNQANIKKDLTVAGLNGDGTSNGNDDAMVDAIGQYKIAPPNGMALRNPRMQQILAKVADKYPDFDATSYGARQTAAKSFSTGKDAQNVQSANTALNHLDTIEQLAMAQKNGNVPLFNKIANQIAANTGQPAPTNLSAAIAMVAPELTKAVVGSGGGVGERAHFAENLNPNGSPDQILGGLGAIKELMGGRLSEVERTYSRSTGRKDFRDSFLSPAAQKILAARASADGSAAPTVPSDIAAILAKHGGK